MINTPTSILVAHTTAISGINYKYRCSAQRRAALTIYIVMLTKVRTIMTKKIL